MKRRKMIPRRLDGSAVLTEMRMITKRRLPEGFRGFIVRHVRNHVHSSERWKILVRNVVIWMRREQYRAACRTQQSNDAWIAGADFRLLIPATVPTIGRTGWLHTESLTPK
jgi:hypothetical protein